MRDGRRTDMLDLDRLATAFNPGISSHIGGSLAEAGAVCLESQGHVPGVRLSVTSKTQQYFTLSWTRATLQAFRGWNDPIEATEDGAAGIAVLLSNLLLGHLVIARSRRGTGFDYYLGDRNTNLMTEAEQAVTGGLAPLLEDDGLVVRGRLEVSGLMVGSDTQVRGRVRQKIHQTGPSDNLGIPAYVIVVEFGRPLAEVREK